MRKYQSENESKQLIKEPNRRAVLYSTKYGPNN